MDHFLSFNLQTSFQRFLLGFSFVHHVSVKFWCSSRIQPPWKMKGKDAGRPSAPPLESSSSQGHGPPPPSLSLRCNFPSAPAQLQPRIILTAARQGLSGLCFRLCESPGAGRQPSPACPPKVKRADERGWGLQAGASLTGGIVEHTPVDVVADLLHVLLQPRQVCRAQPDGLAPPQQLRLHV